MSSKKRLTVLIFSATAALALIAGMVVLLDPFGRFEDQTRNESTARIPILMYHHFADEGSPSTVISAAQFENQIKALSDAGYTAITFEELCDYVFSGAPLPERPLIITIDDGYLSVYETAFPILKKYDMKATVFIIGVSHGKSVYKDTQHPITPRFNNAQALEMAESGIISIQSHSYDMHQHEPFETDSFREGVLQRDDESDEDYIKSFTADFQRAAAQIEDMLRMRPFVYSYPFGFYSDMSEMLLRNLDVKVTLTTVYGVNTVVIDSPESLFGLKRFNIHGDMSVEELLATIDVSDSGTWFTRIRDRIRN